MSISLGELFKIDTPKAKFIKSIHIPTSIKVDNRVYKIDKSKNVKYGGYGIIIFYENVVLKILTSLPGKVFTYITPELEGVKLAQKLSKYFIKSSIINLKHYKEYSDTSFKNVYRYNTINVSMVLMERYHGDIYLPILKNKFSHKDKQSIFKLIITLFLELLKHDKIYGDIKLEQILYKTTIGTKIKLGDLGSITNLDNSIVIPTFSPRDYAIKHKLNTDKLLLFSLGTLWFDLYRDQKNFNNFVLSYDKINYDITFNYALKSNLDLINNYDDFFSKQKKLVYEWMIADLTNLNSNKEFFTNEFNKMLVCIQSHDDDTGTDKS